MNFANSHILFNILSSWHTSDIHIHTSLTDNNQTTWTSVGNDDDDLLWPLKCCLNISSLLCVLWSYFTGNYRAFVTELRSRHEHTHKITGSVTPFSLPQQDNYDERSLCVDSCWWWSSLITSLVLMIKETTVHFTSLSPPEHNGSWERHNTKCTLSLFTGFTDTTQNISRSYWGIHSNRRLCDANMAW